VATAPVRAEEGCTGGSSGPRMAAAVGATGGGAGRGLVPQATAAPVDVDKGGAGGSSGS
jgi:hypothetical protein